MSRDQLRFVHGPRRRHRAFFALGFALASFACGSENGDADPAPEPEAPALADLEPVDKLELALFGRGGSAEMTSLALQSTGTRYLPNEGFTPSSDPAVANVFGRDVIFDFSQDSLRVDTSREVEFLFPGRHRFTDVLRGNLGTTTEGFFGSAAPSALSSDKAAAIRRQETLLSPHALVRSLMQAGTLVSDGDETIDGATHHRLMADGDVYPMTLFVDAETGQLSRVETLELDYYLRDVTLEVGYSGWLTTAAGIAYPANVTLSRAGQVLQAQETASFSYNFEIPDGSLDFPEGPMPELDPDLYARGEASHQWYFLLDSIGLPFAGIDTSINAVEIAPGVHQLQGGSHHSFLVEQSDGVVLVDAPLHDDRGQALARFVESEIGKPIKFVVSSHFHEDHAAGIREVLGETDAELVVHESVEGFWRGLLAAESTLSPDALGRSPRSIDIRTVPDDGSLTLDDGEHPVTLYDMNSTHADDLLLARDDVSNTVFVVDVYSPGNGGIAPGELEAALTSHAIPTDALKIVGGHGAEMHDYATFQSSL